MYAYGGYFCSFTDVGGICRCHEVKRRRIAAKVAANFMRKALCSAWRTWEQGVLWEGKDAVCRTCHRVGGRQVCCLSLRLLVVRDAQPKHASCTHNMHDRARTRTHAQAHTHAHTCTLCLSLSLSHTHTCAHVRVRTRAQTYMHNKHADLGRLNVCGLGYVGRRACKA
jgi:hypothetical protein